MDMKVTTTTMTMLLSLPAWCGLQEQEAEAPAEILLQAMRPAVLSRWRRWSTTKNLSSKKIHCHLWKWKISKKSGSKIEQRCVNVFRKGNIERILIVAVEGWKKTNDWLWKVKSRPTIVSDKVSSEQSATRLLFNWSISICFPVQTNYNTMVNVQN